MTTMRLLLFTLFAALAYSKNDNSHLYELVPEGHDMHRRLSDSSNLHFFVHGDTPYLDRELVNLPLQMESISPQADFIMHVGDIKRRSTHCRERQYTRVRDILTETSLIPIFLTIGDNDVVECEDSDAAYGYWQSTFGNTESLYESIPYTVERQVGRSENFAFSHEGILVMGLHILHASFSEHEMLYNIVEDTLLWLQSHETAMRNAKAVVLFGHTFPFHPGFSKVREYLETMVVMELPEIPFLFVQGEMHVFLADNPIIEAHNFLRVVVDKGGNADPLEVTVDGDSDVPFKIKRRSLLTSDS